MIRISENNKIFETRPFQQACHEVVRHSFVESNQCADPDTNDCDVNAICTDTKESYSCACKPGYFGTGVELNKEWEATWYFQIM